jgi:hypothetical protein
VNHAFSKLQRRLSLICATWLAIASCALGCAQAMSLPVAEAGFESATTIGLTHPTQMAMEVGSCHESKGEPKPADGKQPAHSQTLACCPLEATLAHKTEFTALQSFVIATHIAGTHELETSDFTIGRTLRGQQLEDGRDTHVRLRVFRI